MSHLDTRDKLSACRWELAWQLQPPGRIVLIRSPGLASQSVIENGHVFGAVQPGIQDSSGVSRVQSI